MLLRITPRDRTVLQLLANGTEAFDIAIRLGIPAQEFDSHLNRLFSAIGARSRAEAVEVALRRGLLVAEVRA